MNRILRLTSILLIFGFFSCSDDESAIADPDIIGSYLGTLEVSLESGGSETVTGEELEIILVNQDEALIQFNSSSVSGTTVYNYNARIINDFTLSVDQEEVTPGTIHTGQASLSGSQISLLIKDLDFGDDVLSYQGEKL